MLNGTSERAFVASARRRSGNVCFLRWIWQNGLIASVLQSLARATHSGVCATRGTSSISDSLLGIEAADVALLVVRVLAAAIPSEDYWRFSDVSRGVRAAPRRAPTSEGLRQGPHTSRCVRPRTAVRATTPPSAQRCLQASGRLQRALTSEMAAGLNCFWFTGLTQPKLKFGARSAP